MKKTKLTWLDRLMVDITFAEAGVAEPVWQSKNGCKDLLCACSEEREALSKPGQHNTIQAY